MFGELSVSQLLITSTTISYLSNFFVIAELFCNMGRLNQFSDGYTYPRTFIEHQIPKNVDECLIRIRDNKGNTLIKYIDIDSSF